MVKLACLLLHHPCSPCCGLRHCGPTFMWVSAANYMASLSTNVFCWSPVTSTRNGLRCYQLVLTPPGWSLTSSHLCLLTGVFTTDMGLQLISVDFASFMEEKGIKHVRTALYHPQANGGVERFNQTHKNGLRAHLAEGLPLSSALHSTLFHFRAMKHTTGSLCSSLSRGIFS